MKIKFFALFLFVTLGTLSATAQTFVNNNPIPMGECIGGQKYSVVTGNILSSPYNEEENWKKLLEVNPDLKKKGRIIGNQQTATILPGDAICIPAGTVVADFLENGDYVPTLVAYKGPIVTTLPAILEKTEEIWYEDPLTLFCIFSALGLVLLVVARIHTLGGREKKTAVRKYKNKRFASPPIDGSVINDHESHLH